MRRMMDKVLQRYGIQAQVEHEGRTEAVRIFFQPSTSKSWQNMEPVMGPLGKVPGGQYLYIESFIFCDFFVPFQRVSRIVSGTDQSNVRHLDQITSAHFAAG